MQVYTSTESLVEGQCEDPLELCRDALLIALKPHISREVGEAQLLTPRQELLSPGLTRVDVVVSVHVVLHLSRQDRSLWRLPAHTST